MNAGEGKKTLRGEEKKTFRRIFLGKTGTKKRGDSEEKKETYWGKPEQPLQSNSEGGSPGKYNRKKEKRVRRGGRQRLHF